VWCPKRINGPVTAFFTVGNQHPDANDRVVDVLGELVAQLGSNFIVGLADMAVRGGEAFRSGTVSMSHTMMLLMCHSTDCPSKRPPTLVERIQSTMLTE
jgi:hypothetical protein